MKTWLLTLMVGAFTILIMPVRAQDLLFTPDAYFPISDLGISLPVPSNWTYRVVDGVYFGASESDLDIASDGDVNTVPAEPVMQLTATPFESLGVRDSDNIATIASAVRDSLGLQTSLDAFDNTVTGRHALTWFGQIGDSAGMIVTVWTQDRQVVVLTLTTPDASTITDYATSWGVVVGNIKFTDVERLRDTANSDYGFTLNIPSGWTILNLENQGLFGLFEQASDAQIVTSGATDAMQGVTLVVTQRSTNDVQLQSDATTDDLLYLLSNNLGLQQLTNEGDFYVNDVAGVGVSGVLDNGRWMYPVATIDNKNDLVTFYMLSAPDERTLRDFVPTFLTMLDSVTIR